MIENIKKLRTMTGCGMLDCKNALHASENNLEKAALWLRKKGITKAAKKVDRDAFEGAIGVAVADNWGALLKITSETDFVARNEKFQLFASGLLKELKEHRLASLEDLKKHMLPSGQTAEDEAAALTGILGESIRLEDLQVVKGEHVAAYVHNAYSPQLGRIGVLVGLDSTPSLEIKTLGENLAMHIAASPPLALNRAGIEKERIEKECRIFEEEARAAGKPDAALKKIVDGRLNKFYADIVLLDQPFIMDTKKTVENVITAAGTTITDFSRMQIG